MVGSNSRTEFGAHWHTNGNRNQRMRERAMHLKLEEIKRKAEDAETTAQAAAKHAAHQGMACREMRR